MDNYSERPGAVKRSVDNGKHGKGQSSRSLHQASESTPASNSEYQDIKVDVPSLDDEVSQSWLGQV